MSIWDLELKEDNKSCVVVISCVSHSGVSRISFRGGGGVQNFSGKVGVIFKNGAIWYIF